MRQWGFLLLLVAALAWLGMRAFPGSRARAQDVAPVASDGSVTLVGSGTVMALTDVAPVGTCERCGRTVYGAWTTENCRLVVHDRRGGGVRWSGCMDCLYDVLRRNP